MKIDLDELVECSKCGCVFNYLKASYEIEHETDNARTPIYNVECPCCKHKDKIWSN